MSLLRRFSEVLLWPVLLVFWCTGRVFFLILRERHEGMWVVDTYCDNDADENDAEEDNDNMKVPDFAEQVARALRFIREHDPRRANWIQQHLKYIVSADLTHFGGCYIHALKSCFVSWHAQYQAVAGWGTLTEQAQQVLTMKLASLIVHEATHGRVEDAGVRYRNERRVRIEQLCRRQEMQFMNRAAPDFCDLEGTPIDWAEENDFEKCREQYEKIWSQTRWQRVSQLLRGTFPRWFGEDTAEEASTTWQEYHESMLAWVEAYRPWCDSMLLTRAGYYWNTKNYVEACNDYRTYVKLNPDETRYRSFLASLYFDQERWGESIALWEELHAEGEAHAACWIGVCLRRLDRHQEALDWVDRELDSADTAYVASLRGRILAEMGRHREALEYYNQAELGEDKTPFNNDDFSMLTEQALLLGKLNRNKEFDDAREELRTIAGDWWQTNCEAQPRPIEAFVLRAPQEIYEPGVLSAEALLLVCPDFADEPGESGFLERIADHLLDHQNSDALDHESLYLRSLLQRNDDYPWREVTDSFTDERLVYVVDINLDRLFLSGEMLTGNYVTCLLGKWDGADTVYLQVEDCCEQSGVNKNEEALKVLAI